MIKSTVLAVGPPKRTCDLFEIPSLLYKVVPIKLCKIGAKVAMEVLCRMGSFVAVQGTQGAFCKLGLRVFNPGVRFCVVDV